MMQSMEFSLEQIAYIAEQVISKMNSSRSEEHAVLVTFSGDLGAGKTTLIQEIARQLGVTDTLQSPTYVIYKKYSTTTGVLVHGDMYRLESGEEIKKLGWDELLADPKNILLIEWPEKIADVIPDWAVKVTIQHRGVTMRYIDIVE